MNALIHQQMDGSANNWIQVQTKRAATGNILASLFGNITVTWDAEFPSTNYTISYGIQTSGTGLLGVDSIVSKSTTGCVIAVKNLSLATQSGTIHLTAIHD